MTKELLTKSEEAALIEAAQKEDGTPQAQRAINKLVEHNTGLVHKIVGKFPMKNATCSYDDLYQEGLLGLIHGIRKFDVTRGYRLSTYAYNWISAYVRKFYYNHYRAIRLPVHVSLQNNEVNQTIERLTRELGRVPSVEEVCDIHDKADQIICNSLYTLSLNALQNEDSEVIDNVKDPNQHSVDTELDVYFLLESLKSTVSERDYNILIQRFGLNGETEHTLQELAEINKITRARIHQVENNMIKKLRQLANQTN